MFFFIGVDFSISYQIMFQIGFSSFLFIEPIDISEPSDYRN